MEKRRREREESALTQSLMEGKDKESLTTLLPFSFVILSLDLGLRVLLSPSFI